jgi:peptidoglycan/LPS O-acetylase OafA/YrhL
MGARQTHRFGSLDGLRGIAALIVVLVHTQGALQMPAETRAALFVWLAPILNGDGALRVFFVLSGFVLTHSIRGDGPVLGYWVKRYLRIQLPFMCALIFAWLLSFGYIESSGLSRWLGSLSRVHLSPNQLVASLWLPGKAGGQLSVGWTLTIEMVLSLALPAMVWFARRTHWLVLLALAALPLLFQQPNWQYAFDFALGITAYEKRETMAAWIRRSSQLRVSLVFGLSLLAWNSNAGIVTTHVPPEIGNPIHLIVLTLGSFGLVVLAAHWRPLVPLLCSRPVARVGLISYSLYLVHLPVVTFLGPRIGGEASVWTVVSLYAGVLTVSLLLAEIGYRFIERPAIRAGHAAASRIRSALA